jgi:hypothetical protein
MGNGRRLGAAVVCMAFPCLLRCRISRIHVDVFAGEGSLKPAFQTPEMVASIDYYCCTGSAYVGSFLRQQRERVCSSCIISLISYYVKVIMPAFKSS